MAYQHNLNAKQDNMADKPITFAASFPAIQSAITISGDGSGLRIKLDVPETDLLQALSLLAMRQTAFRVTIEPLEVEKYEPKKGSKY
jgi:hypothetical protein